MAQIPSNFGAGGVGIDPFGTETNLAGILRDIADDLTGFNNEHLTALTSPAATDLPSAITLVNEIRTKWNALAAAQGASTLKTSKGP